MVFSCGIDHLTFANGQTEELPVNGITVIVGPNNVGKTLSLRNISQRLAVAASALRYQEDFIVADIHLTKQGTQDDLTEWMRSKGKPIRTQPNTNQTFYGSYQNNQIPTGAAI
jgi:predicted ATP-binding protein involved in virulence